METENLPPQPSSSDSKTDSLNRSASFEERPLIGAEIDYVELLPQVEGLCNTGEAKLGHSETDSLDRSNSFEVRQLIMGAEVEDTELWPKVEGLSITGEAKPGHTLYAAGFCDKGTVSCDFAWLRLYDNGSQVYIPGEEKAEHLVTADDVDSCLAVEVIPIGKEGQMGDLVRVFANKQKKVACGNKIQDAVEQSFFDGHASFDVCLLEYNEDRQNVKLEFMEDRFIIKDEKLHPIVKMNFPSDMTIAIPRESPTGFEIQIMGAFRKGIRESPGSPSCPQAAILSSPLLGRNNTTQLASNRTFRNSIIFSSGVGLN